MKADSEMVEGMACERNRNKNWPGMSGLGLEHDKNMSLES